jgi:hypothetical protein
VLLDTQLLPIVNRLLLLDDLHRHEHEHMQKQQLSLREGPNQSLAQSQQNSSSTKNDDIPMELERLKQVQQLLILLRTSLQNVVNKVDLSGPSQQPIQNDHETRIHTLLANQIYGIAVPLLNTLQHVAGDRACSNPVSCVVRSANFANMEEAALSLIVLWRFIPRIVDTSSARSSCEENISLIKSLALPILVSSTTALSSVEIKRNNSHYDGNVDVVCEEKNTSHDAGAFDRGEDCAMAVLQLIQTLFKPSDHHTNESEDHVCQLHDKSSFSASLSNEVGTSMGGSLVARVALVCLSFLSQDEIMAGQSKPAHIQKKENSAILQLESLKTLHVLMEGVWLTELWKSILPGCFAVSIGILIYVKVNLIVSPPPTDYLLSTWFRVCINLH